MANRRSFTIGALIAVGAFVAVTEQSAPKAALQSEACSVTVSGARDPTRLPDAMVWEAVFQQQRGNSSPPALALSASPALATLLRVRGAAVIDKVEALRSSLRTNEAGPGARSRDRDLLIADTVLDARDEVARQASPADFDAMLTLAESVARGQSFVVPTAGRIMSRPDGQQYCHATISGRDTPQLIPDHVVWNSAFRMFAKAASIERGSDGRVSDAFVITNQRTGMPSPAADIRMFVDIAADAAAEIAAEQSATRDGSTDAALAQLLRLQRVVMTARQRVLRSVSVEGWRGILARIEKSREDTLVFHNDAR